MNIKLLTEQHLEFISSKGGCTGSSESILVKIQYSPFIMLNLGSIGMDRDISGPCYKGTILQRNYRKMTIKWSFSYNSFVKFYGT